MKLDWAKIGLIISIGLNIFQTASKEAREWYVATNKKPVPDGEFRVPYTDKTLHDTDFKTAKSPVK